MMPPPAELGCYEYEEGAAFRRCYRPSPPPVPHLQAVWDHYEQARRAIEDFDRALSIFPVPNVIGRLFARLDAVHSSGAEGATTTFSDLMEYETELKQAPDLDDARSVAGCGEAFDDLAAGQTPGALAMAQRIHQRLFEKARDPYISASAGRLKSVPNGTYDDDLEGYFYYTHPRSLTASLAEWEQFTAGGGSHPPLVGQCLSHWMFEHIHPFPDGNGRVGRLLVPLLLQRAGVTRTACGFIGEAVHMDKTTYVAALKAARLSGDMTGWTRICLAFLRETATRNLDRLSVLSQLHDRWQAATAGLRKHSAVHRLVPFALTKPVFTVKDAAAELGQEFAYHTVNVAVEKMVALGLVRRSGSRRRDRLFEAPEILRLFA